MWVSHALKFIGQAENLSVWVREETQIQNGKSTHTSSLLSNFAFSVGNIAMPFFWSTKAKKNQKN